MTAHSVCSNGSSAAGDSGSVSVKVAVRTRPLSAMEAAQRNGGFEILSLDQHRRVVTVVPEARNFSYDYVFSPESTQTEVYEELAIPLLDKFFDGYNATILAYGQTSSGKTHTMGTGCAHDYNNDAVGIIPRAINELFERIYHAQQPRSAGGGGGGTRYQVRVSFLEIYNEELIDLLSETGARAQVQIREDPRGNIYWTGVREVLVNSVDEVMEQLEIGSQHRQVGQTDMNEKSSRSHAIFSVTLRQDRNGGDGPGGVSKLAVPRAVTPSGSRINRRASSPLGPHRRAATEEHNTGEWTVVTSKFHFVDLAGSERLKRTNASGDRAKEGISINAGLSALGNVISALGDTAKKATHIPYRDSKLTRLLQDSLGGNSQTLMIACVSPAASNVSETINTLKYANRARNIKNVASKNEEMSNDVPWLQQQVTKLRAEVKALKEGGATSPDGYDDHNARSAMSSPIPQHRPLTPSGMHGANGQLGPISLDTLPPAVVRRLQKTEAELNRVNKSYRHLLVRYEETAAELSSLRDEHYQVMGSMANGGKGGDNNSLHAGNNGNARKGSVGDEALERLNNPAFVAEIGPIIEEYEKTVTQLETRLRTEANTRKRLEDDLRAANSRIRLSEEVQRRKMEEIAQLRDRLRQVEQGIVGGGGGGGSNETSPSLRSPTSLRSTTTGGRGSSNGSISSKSSLTYGSSSSTSSNSSTGTNSSRATSAATLGSEQDLMDLNDLQANIRELEQHFEETMAPPKGMKSNKPSNSSASSNIVLDGCPNLNALSRLLENGLPAK